MTASCAPMTAARLASIASSQSVMKESGASATPSRDNSSYTTTLRTLNTSGLAYMMVCRRLLAWPDVGGRAGQAGHAGHHAAGRALGARPGHYRAARAGLPRHRPVAACGLAGAPDAAVRPDAGRGAAGPGPVRADRAGRGCGVGVRAGAG